VQTVILGSERFDCLPALVDRDPGGAPVLYVPTAADVLDDRAYVQEEMQRLAGMGFQITVLPLAGACRNGSRRSWDTRGWSSLPAATLSTCCTTRCCPGSPNWSRRWCDPGPWSTSA
jgi:hypothetical protein